jgi:hypothetical protein
MSWMYCDAFGVLLFWLPQVRLFFEYLKLPPVSNRSTAFGLSNRFTQSVWFEIQYILLCEINSSSIVDGGSNGNIPFRGATGLWFWEDPNCHFDLNVTTVQWILYERLYRLSQFKDFFAGNTSLLWNSRIEPTKRYRGGVCKRKRYSSLLPIIHLPKTKTRKP